MLETGILVLLIITLFTVGAVALWMSHNHCDSAFSIYYSKMLHNEVNEQGELVTRSGRKLSAKNSKESGTTREDNIVGMNDTNVLAEALVFRQLRKAGAETSARPNINPILHLIRLSVFVMIYISIISHFIYVERTTPFEILESVFYSPSGKWLLFAIIVLFAGILIGLIIYHYKAGPRKLGQVWSRLPESIQSLSKYSVSDSYHNFSLPFRIFLIYSLVILVISTSIIGFLAMAFYVDMNDQMLQNTMRIHFQLFSTIDQGKDFLSAYACDIADIMRKYIFALAVVGVALAFEMLLGYLTYTRKGKLVAKLYGILFGILSVIVIVIISYRYNLDFGHVVNSIEDSTLQYDIISSYNVPSIIGMAFQYNYWYNIVFVVIASITLYSKYNPFKLLVDGDSG